MKHQALAVAIFLQLLWTGVSSSNNEKATSMRLVQERVDEVSKERTYESHKMLEEASKEDFRQAQKDHKKSQRDTGGNAKEDPNKKEPSPSTEST